MTKKKWMATMFIMALLLCLPLFEVQAIPYKAAGSAGESEEELRAQLYRMGYYEADASDYFNTITSNAVSDFQEDFNLPASGIIGPLTRKKLNDVEMMAHIVHGEARGESYAGQVAVAAVILNRVKSPDFPDSIEKVIFQKNAFTAVNDGQYTLVPNEIAYRAVKAALDGIDPSEGAVFYFNPNRVTDSWIYSRPVITKIGRHHFAE